jgi:hypothetical protein
MNDLIKEVQNNSISSKPIPEVAVKPTFNIHQYSYDYWSYKKPKFIQDYKVGKNRGNISTKHIKSDNIIIEFIQYLSQTITHIYNKNNQTTEKLQIPLNILNNISKIINSELKELETFEVEEFIAGMQGVINSFTEKTLGKDNE